MTEFTPRLDTLPPAQQALWPELRAAKVLGFVLYGGTAVALRLGHRISVDFDFFRETPLDRQVLFDSFSFMREVTLLQDQPDVISVMTSSGVKLSFFGPVRFGRIGIPDMTADGVMQVASLDDLMATKLKVVLQRVEAKDYIDIAAMIAAGVQLNRGLAAARKMFAPAFQAAESIKAITYFEGGDLDKLSGNQKTLLVNAANKVSDLPLVEILSGRLGL